MEQFKWHAVPVMEVNRRNQDDREPINFLAEIIATFPQLIVTSVSNSKADPELVEKMDMVTDKVSWILGVLAGFAVVADAVQKRSSRSE